MSIKTPIERPVSAGGVVYRRGEGGEVEVALCGRGIPLMWGLPKGTPDTGETLEQTALREVREETGLRVELQRPVETISYWFVRPPGVRCFKQVHFYLMRVVGGSTDEHDAEFDEVRWFSSDEALAAMNYDNERQVVTRALEMVGQQERSES